MSRPSRLGIALVATVAASSLFAGGGLASAADPVPCTDATNSIPAGCTPGSSTTGSATTGSSTTGSATTGSATTGSATTGSATTGSATTGSATTGGSTTGGATTGGSTTGGSTTGGGGQPPKNEPSKNGPDYQKPPSWKPWKGDKNRPRKDRNDPPRRPGDEKDCRDFDNHDEAQEWFKGHGRPGDKDPSRLDHDKDGEACENDDDDGDDSEPVIPPKIDINFVLVQTDDDDSDAEVSGSQVKDVPEGSVDTGSVQ